MMKLLSVEKGSSVAIFFVYISLATVISSKANVENSAKAWLCKTISKYIITKCVCETRMPPKRPFFFRNETFIFDLDLCR